MLTIVNSLTSVYAGFAIFSVLGFMAKQQGVAVGEVAESGTSSGFSLCLPRLAVQTSAISVHVCSRISKTTRPNSSEFPLHVACGGGSVVV